MSLYALTYMIFIGAEFSLYEVFLQLLEQGNDADAQEHSSLDVFGAGVCAGSIAGLSTNAVEYLAVNK